MTLQNQVNDGDDDEQGGITVLGVEESDGYRADEVLVVEVDGVQQDVPITGVRRSELAYRGETPEVFDVDHVFVGPSDVPHGGAWVNDGEQYVELAPEHSMYGDLETYHDTGRYVGWETDVFDADEVIDDETEFPHIWERGVGDVSGLEVESIRAGTCGDVGDCGGGLPTHSKRFRRKTDCHEPATTQIWKPTEPPENATIIAVCDDHRRAARKYILENFQEVSE